MAVLACRRSAAAELDAEAEAAGACVVEVKEVLFDRGVSHHGGLVAACPDEPQAQVESGQTQTFEQPC